MLFMVDFFLGMAHIFEGLIIGGNFCLTVHGLIFGKAYYRELFANEIGGEGRVLSRFLSMVTSLEDVGHNIP